MQEVHKKDLLWKEQVEKDIGHLQSWQKELPDTLKELLQLKLNKDDPIISRLKILDAF